MKCADALSKIDDYIANRLSRRELEDFLEHVKTCRECYDELEIHYIISVGMKYLEEENPKSYDIPYMLREDLCEKEKMLKKQKEIRIALIVLLLILASAAVTGILIFLGHIELPFLISM